MGSAAAGVLRFGGDPLGDQVHTGLDAGPREDLKSRSEQFEDPVIHHAEFERGAAQRRAAWKARVP